MGRRRRQSGTPVATFAATLRSIITAIQAVGTTRVLVADVPPLEDGTSVSSYNTAIRNVARSTSAQLVELSGLRLDLRPWVGFQIETRRAIADAFTRALA